MKYIKIIFSASFILLFSVLIIENLEQLSENTFAFKVNLLFWAYESPPMAFYLVLIIVFLLGISIASVLSIVEHYQLKRKIRRLSGANGEKGGDLLIGKKISIVRISVGLVILIFLLFAFLPLYFMPSTKISDDTNSIAKKDYAQKLAKDIERAGNILQELDMNEVHEFLSKQKGIPKLKIVKEDMWRIGDDKEIRGKVYNPHDTGVKNVTINYYQKLPAKILIASITYIPPKAIIDFTTSRVYRHELHEISDRIILAEWE